MSRFYPGESMHARSQPNPNASAESLVSPKVGKLRMAIGLAQGVLLYLLYRAFAAHAWPATEPMLFVGLAAACVFGPLLLVSAVGQMAGKRAGQWVLTASAIAGALGAYDGWRHAVPALARHPAHGPEPSGQLVLCLVVGFFIAHSLVMTGAAERRRIASYPGYFETAWKGAVQLGFSALFAGVVWLVLALGAQLFMLVKLSWFRELITEPWFVIPVTVFSFTCAMHLTDVRPAIVRGIRTLLLTLMSWILPVAALIVGGFLATLPFTGLAPLWATRFAATLLLAAAALLVVLVNAAWQNGAAPAPLAIRASARAACLLLAPLCAIAIYALGLRVNEHGWSNDRIVAAACLLVASCYAAGYALAALRKGWLAAIAPTNVATALIVIAVLLALFSPVANPERLSVDNQLARLKAGKVSASEFDYAYLRFEGGRYGRDALAQLRAGAAGKDGAAIRQGVDAALALAGPGPRRKADPILAAGDVTANLTVWPATARLPQTFPGKAWNTDGPIQILPSCLRRAGAKCDVFLLDLAGDARPEVVVIDASGGPDADAAVMAEDAQGRWSVIGALPPDVAGCGPLRDAIAAGRVRAADPAGKALEIDGHRLGVRYHADAPLYPCPR
jgi:hypothetical protein